MTIIRPDIGLIYSFLTAKCIVTPGGDSAYERGGDARRKF